MTIPAQLTLAEWDAHYADLCRQGLVEPPYGGRLSRHVFEEGDRRLLNLRFDNSPAALRLWNFVLTENQRLRQARDAGEKIIGTMKDLGTIPVMAFSLAKTRAFYPDGTWWTPCLMECGDTLLNQAERLGLDSSFCPVRAMVPAFRNLEHFPQPDLLICSTGAVCDDFSAIAQRLERLGYPVEWWEIPRRRPPNRNEPSVPLPGNLRAPLSQIQCVQGELKRLATLLAQTSRQMLDEPTLAAGIEKANQVRGLLAALRTLAYGTDGSPFPALEMLLAEVLAIHFCSDLKETLLLLSDLLAEARARVQRRAFAVPQEAVRVFWVNPVADLRALNLLENWGGRICGSDYMFGHALLPIPNTVPPLEGLAMAALADPMVGSAQDRAAQIVAACRATGAEAAVVSRIPGASHCAWEGAIIRGQLRSELDLPCIEIEVPPLSDALMPTLSSRIQALIEGAKARRA